MERIEYFSPEVLIFSVKAKKVLTQSGYGDNGSAGDEIGEHEIPGW